MRRRKDTEMREEGRQGCAGKEGAGFEREEDVRGGNKTRTRGRKDEGTRKEGDEGGNVIGDNEKERKGREREREGADGSKEGTDGIGSRMEGIRLEWNGISNLDKTGYSA
ncbi:hypothetical protein C8R44DRAFT_746110 [Mycena epipterygia]|nr:hypothetical protein C8R44DRAFT_746110 [Mycena epipterygia]